VQASHKTKDTDIIIGADLPTEELAELHAIIQAIEYQQRNCFTSPETELAKQEQEL